MQVLKGLSVNEGIVFGTLKYYDASPPLVEKRISDNPLLELERYHSAHAQAVAQLDKLHEETVQKLGEDNALLFEIHRMMLEDLDYIEAIEGRIAEAFCAEYAVWQTAADFGEMFAQMDDEYMQARASDVKDVSFRLINHLTNRTESSLASDRPVILAAVDLMPSETARLSLDNTLAIVTAKGSISSHTAIFARGMGIPAVLCLGDTLSAALDGKSVALDAAAGTLYIEPDGGRYRSADPKSTGAAAAKG